MKFIESFHKYVEQLNDDISKKNLEATLINTKLEEMREICATQKVFYIPKIIPIMALLLQKRVYESVQSMLKEMSDLGEANFGFTEKVALFLSIHSNLYMFFSLHSIWRKWTNPLMRNSLPIQEFAFPN